jgi:alpha-galactosidase
MKNSVSLLFCIILLFLFSCTRIEENSAIKLDSAWKFKTGNDLAWAAKDFDDSSWDTIHPTDWWENQGYKNLDGYAWYRTRVIIPSSLKDVEYFKDSIQFLLGKIDDCDQVFLNGSLIGENGRSILTNQPPTDEFIKLRDIWSLPRWYVLPASDPRILWDQENVIAVRAYDQQGLGGMFSKPFEIAMTGLQDYIKFDLTSTGFDYTGDSIVSKKIILKNVSGKLEFKGILSVRIISRENQNLISEQTAELNFAPGATHDFTFTVSEGLKKPVYAMITFTDNASGDMVSEELGLPYILTPPVGAAPQINGAKVFGVRPGSPFLFKVAATGNCPLRYYATDLPEGLKIDSVSGIIKGSIRSKGEHKVMLKVTNEFGCNIRELKIIVGNLISLTPPLGWNSWNCWGLSVSDTKVCQSAREMINSGLIDHGWTYVNIDDGWEDKHDKDGKILTNSKFPNMYGMCDYIHSLGLKVGIYSSPGTKTCGGYEGSYGYEEKDARMYASWGIDYLKYDWCSYGWIAPNPTLDQMKHPYQVMKRALRGTGRDIHYSLCQYGMGDVWKWGEEVDGNSWRTTGDITDTWESMSEIGFSQDDHSLLDNWLRTSSPGRWNDPDMLVVGWVGWGPQLHYTRLTPDEQYTHITLWSLLAAPLLIGCDMNRLDPFTLNLLTNDEVLAVNQDPLGKQAWKMKANAEYQIWVKQMEDGSKAIGFFNLTEKPVNIPLDLSDLQMTGKYLMRDLWSQQDLGKVRDHFEIRVMPHGARLVSLKD